MMTRRWLLLALALLGVSPVAGAQRPMEPHRIVVIGNRVPKAIAAFQQGLRENGWREGENVLVEYRFLGGKTASYSVLAAELVRPEVSVIVASSTPMLMALKRATTEIPIVMTAAADPVENGLVASLARPGGNITGVSNLSVEFPGKWLELMKECLPGAARFTVLRNLANPSHDTMWSQVQAAAVTLGFSVASAGYRNPEDLESAFAVAGKQRTAAILIWPDIITVGQPVRVAKLALRQRLPSIALYRENVIAGGLMSYGPDISVNYRQAAEYVDKILRGAKPADLPVEQPREFELVVNLKTAKALGIAIPDSILLRADEVFR